jgi:hypothetical protein
MNNRIKLGLLFWILCTTFNAQLKIGSNPTSINSNSQFEIESQTGDVFVVTKDSTNVGIGTLIPSENLTIINSSSPSEIGMYSNVTLPTTSNILISQIKLGPSKNWFTTIRNVLPSGSIGTDLSDLQMTTGQASNNNTQVPRLTIKAISGNVGVGTTTPTSKLEIAGDIKIVDGTQGAGKVLTSDANGKASWQSSNLASGSLYGMVNIIGSSSATVGAGGTIDVPGVSYTHTVPSGVTSQTVFITVIGYAPNNNGDANGGQGTFNLIQNNVKISSSYYAVANSPTLSDLPIPITLIKAVVLTPGNYTFKVSCSSWANTAIVNHTPTNYVGYNGDTEAMKTRMSLQIFNN